MSTIARRDLIAISGAALGLSLTTPARADAKSLTIGVSLPLTGELARQARVVLAGVRFAVDEANAKGGVAGYAIKLLVLDDGSPTTGQYDPALSATNARRMVTDPAVIAAVAPVNSGSAKAMCPVLSQAGMAMISGSATNPDLNDRRFWGVYHPAGQPNFFRTVTTDAYQGPGLANYFAEQLGIKKIVVFDDTGAYGSGMANAFAGQATKKGMTVLIRDRLDPLNADYSAAFTRAKSLGAEALYYGGDPTAGVKVIKQSYAILPQAVKGGGDGVHTPDMLTGGAMPAIEGWYATSAAAHVLEQPSVQPWAQRFREAMKQEPADYTITWYDATEVVLNAIERVAASDRQMTRDAVRAAMLTTKMPSLQGEIAFDPNGDLASTVVSIYQVKYDPAYPIGDVLHQFRYVGAAPEA